ncbi:MAG TPA: YSC84-related protein [Burkholderiales bacterium]|nr:YSC84-related protein [Burkholderiales bacterium]
MKTLTILALSVIPLIGAPLHAEGLLKEVENTVSGQPPSQSDVEKTRQQVRQVSQDALATLGQINPAARQAISRAPGYAVFSAFGVKIMVAGGTTGRGVVVDQRSRSETFMKMVQAQAGLGFGVEQDRLIFVFTEEQALRNFIDQGWEFGGQAKLSAMAEGAGGMMSGAASVAPGVYLYQLTQSGLAATITVSGTKFFVDSALN